jgi:hypothetical protein
MRVRLLVPAVAALVVVLAAPAWGQELPTLTPTPTPTPTVTPEPTPTPEELKQAELRKRKDVKRVYRDYEADGELKTCVHKRRALRRTLRSVDDLYDVDYPDFKPTLEAAIEDYREELRRCEEEEEAEEAPTPAPASPPAPPTTPAPAAPPAPAPESGDAPDVGGGGGGGGGGNDPPAGDRKPAPPAEGDVAPVQPSPTPVPPPVAPVEPQLAVSPGGDSNLLLPALLLAAALVGLGLAGASALAARRGGRLAGWDHAWQEAAYRATGAWGDFSDWLRLGR